MRTIAKKTRHIKGWQRQGEDLRDHLYSTARPTAPRSCDLSAKCPPVEDQGDIGSCTANSGSSAVEYVAGVKTPLSRLFLYYATRVWVEGDSPLNDNGAMIRDVMKALVKYGVCKETLQPYDVTKFAKAPSEKAKADALTRQIVQYKACKTITSIKACIAAGYPAVGGFDCPEGMFTAEVERTGIVPMPANDIVGGHAVLFVGYDDATQLLKFQNSWGKSWGKDGFGYLPYDYLMMGYADDFWTVRTIEMPSTPAGNWFTRLLQWLGLG